MRRILKFSAGKPPTLEILDDNGNLVTRSTEAQVDISQLSATYRPQWTAAVGDVHAIPSDEPTEFGTIVENLNGQKWLRTNRHRDRPWQNSWGYSASWGELYAIVKVVPNPVRRLCGFEEPKGLGAVVLDEHGVRWVRWTISPDCPGPWCSGDEKNYFRRHWRELLVTDIVSPGLSE